MQIASTLKSESTMAKENENYDKRRLWGRAQGRPLSPHQAGLVQTLLPQIAINPAAPLAQIKNGAPVILEIGFGGGEHVLALAARRPDAMIFGAEPFLNGTAKALTGIDKQALTNVCLHHGDVWEVLENLPDARLESVYILFPDPWPKPRHFKRRLVQEALIAEIYRVLRLGGALYFASDIVSYVDWALARILRHGGFAWQAEDSADWLTPYPDWPGTKYQAKAIREGRTPHYLTFVKTEL